jgi:hypothetical protein
MDGVHVRPHSGRCEPPWIGGKFPLLLGGKGGIFPPGGENPGQCRTGPTPGSAGTDTRQHSPVLAHGVPGGLPRQICCPASVPQSPLQHAAPGCCLVPHGHPLGMQRARQTIVGRPTTPPPPGASRSLSCRARTRYPRRCGEAVPPAGSTAASPASPPPCPRGHGASVPGPLPLRPAAAATAGRRPGRRDR